MTETSQPSQKPIVKPIGPKRRWLVLLAWAALLASVIAVQWLTAGHFQTGYPFRCF